MICFHDPSPDYLCQTPPSTEMTSTLSAVTCGNFLNDTWVSLEANELLQLSSHLSNMYFSIQKRMTVWQMSKEEPFYSRKITLCMGF